MHLKSLKIRTTAIQQRWGKNLPRCFFLGLSLLFFLLSLFPVMDRIIAQRQALQATVVARKALNQVNPGNLGESGRWHLLPCLEIVEKERLLEVKPRQPILASWGNVGGCGVGGGSASSTSGGVKWIGRGVTGGRFDIQCTGSETFYNGGYFTATNTRLAGRLSEKWILGANFPILYKVQGVTVDISGTEKTASISGFGDLSFDITRKLGITNANLATLSVSAPVGAYDAIRQGIVLPQQLQLGSGVLSASAIMEHTMDRDWGMMLWGGSFTYGGWENDIGDFRASNLNAYGYVGYILGPFVPSAGLTLTGKFSRDRQRFEELDSPFFLSTVSLATEWSMDVLAVLLSSSLPFSSRGFEGFTLSLGVSTSLF